MTNTQKTLYALAAILSLLLISSTYRDPSPATTIGRTKVPTLHCQEDEVIGFDMSGEVIPAPLMCIHIDDLRGIAPAALSPDARAQGQAEDAYDQGYAEGLAAH